MKKNGAIRFVCSKRGFVGLGKRLYLSFISGLSKLHGTIFNISLKWLLLSEPVNALGEGKRSKTWCPGALCHSLAGRGCRYLRSVTDSDWNPPPPTPTPKILVALCQMHYVIVVKQKWEVNRLLGFLFYVYEIIHTHTHIFKIKSFLEWHARKWVMYAAYFVRQPYVTIKQHKIVNDAEFSLKPFSTALSPGPFISSKLCYYHRRKKKKNRSWKCHSWIYSLLRWEMFHIPLNKYEKNVYLKINYPDLHKNEILNANHRGSGGKTSSIPLAWIPMMNVSARNQ